MKTSQAVDGVGHDGDKRQRGFLEKYLQLRFYGLGKATHQMHLTIPFRIWEVGSMPIQWLQHFEIPKTYGIDNNTITIILFLMLRCKNC